MSGEEILSITDSWVIRYEKVKNILIGFGISSSKAEDYSWLKHNLHNYCDNETEKKILQELSELHK